MKAGTLLASGPSGIGCAGTTACAEAGASSSATTAATAVSNRRERRSELAFEDVPTSPPQAWLGDEIYRPGSIPASNVAEQE
jgi:hypothetical protein